MQGEIISIETAQEISALKRENEQLKKELQKLKNKTILELTGLKTIDKIERQLERIKNGK